MVLSVAIRDATEVPPSAGPPARISIRTPVLTPPATSGPTTRLCAASIW